MEQRDLNRAKIILSIFFVILLIPISAKGQGKGLRFRSYEADKEERTSLDITYKNNLKFKKYLNLEFDVRVLPEAEHYGHIAEIQIGKEDKIELLLTNFPYPHLSYLLLYNKKVIDQYSLSNKDDFFEWTHFQIECVTADSLFSVLENGRTVARNIRLPRDRNVKITFGADYASQQVISDIAPIVLRNVSVSTSPGETRYYWPLDIYAPNKYVYDTLHRYPALLLNPYVNNHTRWKAAADMDFDSKVFFVKGDGLRAYFITRNTVYQYDFACDSITARYHFEPELPLKLMKNQFLYDAPRNRIVLYDFDRQQEFSWFDFNSSSWSYPYTRRNNYTYLHHNKLFSPADSSLLQLFGYGFHRYRSLLYRQAPDGTRSKTDWSATIRPRYLSAVGATDSMLYIYGGLGNETGKQEFGSEIFNDFYRVDLRSFQVEKLWEKETAGNSEVAAPSLLIDSTGDKFLGLFFCPNRYSTSLQLREFNIHNGESRPLADTIPFIFHDTGSEVELVAMPQLDKLFAVVSHCIDDNHFKTNIYSIFTPILSEEPIRPSRKPQIPALIGSALLIGGGFILLLKRRRMKNRVAPPKIQSDDIPADLEPASKTQKAPGIYLLGNFQVIDRTGTDITAEFSSILKQLLILIILYTAKNGKGVSNTLLKEIFWYDKSEQSVRNNRNVNMRKLRKLLEGVGGFEITTDNSYWKMNYTREESVCDWAQAVMLLNEVQKETAEPAKILPKIVHIASQGLLLPNSRYEWLDPFKAAYSDTVVTALGKLREDTIFSADFKIQLQLSDCILLFDSLDEESMRIKCLSLVALGRIGSAKNCFDAFLCEYRQVMGEEYPDSFEKFIQPA